MQLKTLTLRNFRNFESLDIEFSDSVNILVGDNASGKSNLLESIYMLSAAKSHRTYIDDELVYHGPSESPAETSPLERASVFYLKGKLKEPLGEFLVEISKSVDGKKLVKIDGKNQQKISNLVGQVRVVLFSPESIDIIKGSPSNRRKFLNQLISQISSSYLQNLQTYHSALQQRNELLKKIRDENAPRALIEPWNVQIAEAGMYIMSKRKMVIEKLAELSKSKHYQLTKNNEELDVSYNPSIDSTVLDQACCQAYGQSVDTVSSTSDSVQISESPYLKSLRSNFERDINRGTTTIGPHRDDIDILIDDFKARRFCSQGQQRTVTLSIKLAEMEAISLELDEKPILLLDDVASELDERRANLVYELIDRLGVQTFITTTGLDGLKDHFTKKYEFTVEKGSIKRTHT